jgi:hypothetical protein
LELELSLSSDELNQTMSLSFAEKGISTARVDLLQVSNGTFIHHTILMMVVVNTLY